MQVGCCIYQNAGKRQSEKSGDLQGWKIIGDRGSKPFSPEHPLPLERMGYIAIWTVEDIEFDEDGLQFRFAERVCNLK